MVSSCRFLACPCHASFALSGGPSQRGCVTCSCLSGALLQLGNWHLWAHRFVLWSPLPNDVLTVACRMYAFDVHCNSYFPLFILLYGEAAN